MRFIMGNNVGVLVLIKGVPVLRCRDLMEGVCGFGDFEEFQAWSLSFKFWTSVIPWDCLYCMMEYGIGSDREKG